MVTTAPNAKFLLTGVHNGGSNFAMLDGHVKWMMGNNVSPGISAATATSKGTITSSTTWYGSQAAQAAGTASMTGDSTVGGAQYQLTYSTM